MAHKTFLMVSLSKDEEAWLSGPIRTENALDI